MKPASTTLPDLHDKPKNCAWPRCNPDDQIEGRCCGWIESGGSPSSVSTPAQDATALADRLSTSIGPYHINEFERHQIVAALRATSQTPDAAAMLDAEAARYGGEKAVYTGNHVSNILATQATRLRSASYASAGPQAEAVAAALARRLCQMFDSGGESQRSARARHASAIFQLLNRDGAQFVAEQAKCDADPVSYLQEAERSDAQQADGRGAGDSVADLSSDLGKVQTELDEAMTEIERLKALLSSKDERGAVIEKSIAIYDAELVETMRDLGLPSKVKTVQNAFAKLRQDVAAALQQSPATDGPSK